MKSPKMNSVSPLHKDESHLISLKHTPHKKNERTPIIKGITYNSGQTRYPRSVTDLYAGGRLYAV